MPRQSSPVATRYLLARLRPLARPVFWGPAIVLMLMLLFTWEFWMRPEWSSYLLPNADTDTLSPEDKAIGADIDALPVLLNDFGITPNAQRATQVMKPKEAARSTSLADLQGVPIAGSSGGTPSQSSDLTLLGQLGTISVPSQKVAGVENSPSNGLFPIPSVGATQQAGAAPQSKLLNDLLGSAPTNAAPQSPLQAALARYATANPSATATSSAPTAPVTAVSAPPSPIAGTTSLGSFGVNAAPNPAVNAYTSLVEGTQPLSVTPNRPVNTAAPAIVPAIVPQPVAPSPLNAGALPAQSLGASPDAFAPQSTEVIPPNNLPMSAPRPIPGRFIGGGRINTFSNP